MNYDDGNAFFNWAKEHKPKTTADNDVARIPYPSLMDYDSMQDGAYNTKCVGGGNDIENDL